MANPKPSGFLAHNQVRIDKLREDAIAHLTQVTTPNSGDEMVEALKDISLLIPYLDNFPFAQYRVK